MVGTLAFDETVINKFLAVALVPAVYSQGLPRRKSSNGNALEGRFSSMISISFIKTTDRRELTEPFHLYLVFR